MIVKSTYTVVLCEFFSGSKWERISLIQATPANQPNTAANQKIKETMIAHSLKVNLIINVFFPVDIL